MSSIVKVTCISAQLTHDTEMFSNMDPYVVIQCGNQKRKTRTHQEGGKRPLWNDSFSFANPKSQQLKFAVWDEDTVTDDLIGQATVDLSKYTKTPNVSSKEYVSLSYKNKPAGKLYVEITYESSGQPNYMGSNNNNNTWNTNNSNWGGNNNGNNGWGNGSNNNNNGWGSTNNNQQQNWNVQNNTNGWGLQPNNNQQGWGSNNNNGGWGTQQANTQGWGQNQPFNQQNQPGWNPNNFNPNQNNQNGGNNAGYQQPPNMEKKGSNNGVNPYGNITGNDNSNPYPSLDDNSINPLVQNNSFQMVIGAKLFGQQQQPQQTNTNVINILDMAAKGAIQPQNGWNQHPGQNQWNQTPQNQAWNQPNQQNNSWQNNNKPNGWGSGW